MLEISGRKHVEWLLHVHVHVYSLYIHLPTYNVCMHVRVRMYMNNVHIIFDTVYNNHGFVTCRCPGALGQ